MIAWNLYMIHLKNGLDSALEAAPDSSDVQPSPQLQLNPNHSPQPIPLRIKAYPEDADLVDAYSEQISEGDPTISGILHRLVPYRAETILGESRVLTTVVTLTLTLTLTLGERSREWSINIWALPASQPTGKVALCMHGHGSECGVGAWGRFFPRLYEEGYDIIALDAPCFGRSSGPTAQVQIEESQIS